MSRINEQLQRSGIHVERERSIVKSRHNRRATTRKVRFGIFLAIVLMWPILAPAQLNVMISGGFTGAYKKLLPEFERDSGVHVSTGSGASQGAGSQTIAAQLARGVPADVVILSREGLDDLIAAKRILEGTDVDLARVGMGAEVRAGSPKPDVSSVEAFKRTVTNANVLPVPGSTSGIWLIKELFPRLGIADKVKVKITERASEASRMVAAGEADLSILPVSEILNAPGVDYAGPLPDEIQFVQTFAAAIVQGSKQSEAGKRLIDFLASERASAVVRQSGMEPLGKRRTRQ